MNTPQPETLSPGEAARMLGVTRGTLVRWAKAGKIPSFRTLGGHRRYSRADVEAVMRRRGKP